MACNHENVSCATSADWQFVCADCGHTWGDLTHPNADPKVQSVSDLDEWAGLCWGNCADDDLFCDDSEESQLA
jgi:hypothetical protein